MSSDSTADSYHDLHRAAFHNPDGASFLSPYAWMASFIPVMLVHGLWNVHSTSMNNSTNSTTSNKSFIHAYFFDLFSGMIPIALLASLPQFSLLVLRFELTLFLATVFAEKRLRDVVLGLVMEGMGFWETGEGNGIEGKIDGAGKKDDDKEKKNKEAKEITKTDPKTSTVTAITEYRALIMSAVCVVILACDFTSVYPRTQVKVQKQGYSIMDAGVGCFVFANGVSHARGFWRGIEASSNDQKNKNNTNNSNTNIFTLMKSLAPLLILGVGRGLVVWIVDYPVPLEEYGLHWNFFFTLAVVGLVSGVVLPRILPLIGTSNGRGTSNGHGTSNGTGLLILTIILLVGYNSWLYLFNGTEVVLDDSDYPRKNSSFIMQNREGICSVFGFLPLYWSALVIGKDVDKAPLFVIAGVLTGVQLVAKAVNSNSTSLIGNLTSSLISSRRCSNAGYVLYIIGINSLGLGLIRLKQRVVVLFRKEVLKANSSSQTITTASSSASNSPALTPVFLNGVQSSLLFIFLIANLLTGLVNVFCKPLLVQGFFSGLGIIVMYCVGWMSVAFVLGYKGWKVKFW